VPGAAGGSSFEFRLTTPVIATGAAAAALTVGAIITGSLALTSNDDFERAVVRSNDPSLTQSERDQARADGLAAASTADTTSILTDIFVVGAITSAGLAAFFIVIDGMDGGTSGEAQAASAPRVLAVPTVSRDGAGLLLQGAF
jgi:hypothetical protein